MVYEEATEARIVGAVPIPIGKLGGAQGAACPYYDPGALVLKESVERAGVMPNEFDSATRGIRGRV